MLIRRCLKGYNVNALDCTELSGLGGVLHCIVGRGRVDVIT